MSNVSSDDIHKLKIVLDTSVLVAAFLRRGLAYSIIEQALARNQFHLVISADIIDEFTKILIGRSDVSQEDVEAFVRTVSQIALFVTPQPVVAVRADPNDNIIVGTAIAGNATLIVSLDKHLLKLKRYKTIGIVHPRTLTWILPPYE